MCGTFRAHAQSIIGNGEVGGLSTGLARFNSTVQLALHCLQCGLALPRTNGELAWEEQFVGPVVSYMFRRTFAGVDKELRVVWKG